MSSDEPDLGAAPQYDHDLTPADIQRQLRWLYNALAQATMATARARNAEVEAKHAYERARRAALMSAQCPRVTRGGYTVADRDAWVDEQCDGQRQAYELAMVARQASEDLMRLRRDQSLIVMSLARQVETAYNMSGLVER